MGLLGLIIIELKFSYLLNVMAKCLFVFTFVFVSDRIEDFDGLLGLPSSLYSPSRVYL